MACEGLDSLVSKGQGRENDRRENQMPHEPIVYRLEHATATVELELGAERLKVETCGRGLLDKPKVHDVLPSDVTAFAVVPTIGAQNLVGRQGTAEPYDHSYDSELLIVLRVDGAPVKRRMFVNSQNPDLQRFIAELAKRCPAASLLHLEPTEARSRMGFASPRSTVLVILFVLIGLPLFVALLMLAYTILTQFR